MFLHNFCIREKSGKSFLPIHNLTNSGHCFLFHHQIFENKKTSPDQSIERSTHQLVCKTTLQNVLSRSEVVSSQNKLQPFFCACTLQSQGRSFATVWTQELKMHISIHLFPRLTLFPHGNSLRAFFPFPPLLSSSGFSSDNSSRLEIDSFFIFASSTSSTRTSFPQFDALPLSATCSYIHNSE